MAFQVEKLQETIQRLEESGFSVTEGTTEISNGTKFIFTEDPDKYEIELMEYPE